MTGASRRGFLAVFAGACVLAVYGHEIGHAVAGWVQGIPSVPTPVKTYTLRPEVDWSRQIWIALGGVGATAVVSLGTLMWYSRSQRPRADAVLAGVLVPLFAYSARFALAGRGHDGLEWQAAEAALGADPSGPLVDLLLLVLLLAGILAWVIRRRASIRAASLFRAAGLLLVGLALLMFLQASNNWLFDRFFRPTAVTGVPPAIVR